MSDTESAFSDVSSEYVVYDYSIRDKGQEVKFV